jgi:KDO2-lipid IV(A) lauroyltransferase
MSTGAKRMKRRLLRGLARMWSAVSGVLAVGILRTVRLVNPDLMTNFASWFMRKVGPLLPEHEVGRANLAAAFPEKSPAEIETILAGAWDNLGRVGAEFANLDRIWDFDPLNPKSGRIRLDDADVARFNRLADDGKPALIFSAHLANWELPAICAATYGLDAAVLYRRPNVAGIDKWLRQTRAASMGELVPAGLEAPMKLAAALQRGAHVGMLVDQYYVRGVPVTFFGRRTMANPLLARLAQHFDCPIHGVRVIRLPGNRFTAEISEAVVPARDADGKIDIAATMQIITNVIEGWIREHPEQWLWLHRRWRPEDERPPR